MQKMIRDLTDNEIHALLDQQSYGHLGCLSPKNTIYIVPVTYVYKEHALYVFSFEGTKIDYMRTNPSVCFQTEKHMNAESWQSAIVWGQFEELTGEERTQAFDLLLERLWSESNRDHPLYFPFRNSRETLEAAKHEENVVLYRITIEKQTGRMEQYEGT